MPCSRTEQHTEYKGTSNGCSTELVMESTVMLESLHTFVKIIYSILVLNYKNAHSSEM